MCMAADLVAKAAGQGRETCQKEQVFTCAHDLSASPVVLTRLFSQVKKGVNADSDPLIDAATWSKPQPAADAAALSRAQRLSLGSARAAVTPVL